MTQAIATAVALAALIWTKFTPAAWIAVATIPALSLCVLYQISQ